MKKLIFVCLLLMMLAGCHAPVYETIGNVAHVGQNDAVRRQILLTLPDDATVLTASGTDLLYACQDYTLSLQTMPSGDLAATVHTLSGFDASQLTLLHSCCNDHDRYDWVWVAAGENGDVLCRGAILDDGDYHYTLCVSADADADVTDAWNELFRSFCLETDREN